MKLTRKFLSILLIVAMLSVYFVGSVAAETESDAALQTDAYSHHNFGGGAVSGEGAFATVWGNELTYLSDGLLIGMNNNAKLDRTYSSSYLVYVDGVKQIVKQTGTLDESKGWYADGVTQYRLLNGHRFYLNKIHLGYNKGGVPACFSKGVSMHATEDAVNQENWAYAMFNVDGFDTFYSAVGITGAAYTNDDANGNFKGNHGVYFEVYGSKELLTTNQSNDDSFVLLSTSEKIITMNTGEFKVNIKGYKTLKLVVRIDADNATEWNLYKYENNEKVLQKTVTDAKQNDGCEVAWGNACVYKEGYTHMPAGTADFAVLPDYVTYLTEGGTCDSSNYLSDVDPTKVIGYSTWDTKNKPCWNRTYNRTATPATISLGKDSSGNQTAFTMGFGTLAGTSSSDAAGTYVLFNVSGYDRFYSAVGGTNAAMLSNTDIKVVFEVWASTELLTSSQATDASLVMIATSQPVGGYAAGEFDLDIAEYQTLKLVTRYATKDEGGKGTNSSTNSAWGNACVYNVADVKNNVAFESSLGLISAVEASEIGDLFTPTTAKAYITAPDGTVTQSSLTVATDNGKDYYYAAPIAVAGKEMLDVYTVVIRDANGAAVTATESVSVKRYAMALLNGNSSDEFKKIAYSMLQYGAAAQEYFGYNTNEFANSALLSQYDVYKWGEINANTVENVRQTMPEGQYKYATNLQLKEHINLMFYFKNLPTDCYAVITYNDQTSGQIPYSSFLNSDVSDVKIVSTTELAIRDADSTVRCTIYDKNGNVLDWIEDSIQSYAARAVVKESGSSQVCSALLQYIAAAQAVRALPDFETTTGTLCNGTTHDAGNGNYLRVYENVTDINEIYAYEASLAADGFVLQGKVNVVGENRFAHFVKNGVAVYCNYFGAVDEYRIVFGPDGYKGDTSPVTDYEELVTPSVTLMQMTDSALCMVVQLADGSFIIIDGGYGFNASGTLTLYDEYKLTVNRDYEWEMANLMAFLKDNTPDGGTPQVTWMLTHSDPDHLGTPIKFIEKYKDQFALNTVCYNFPNMLNIGFGNDTQNPVTYDARISKFVEVANENFPNVNHYISHTGQKLYLPDCEIEFLFNASEDYYPADMKTCNNTCNAWRMTIAGKTVLITGDIQEGLCNKMVTCYGDYLKSDVMQVIHHGSNGATVGFYQKVQPEVCLWPCMAEYWAHGSQYLPAKTAYNQYLWDNCSRHYNCSATHTIELPSLNERT